MIVKYLQSKTLTPREREELINEDRPFKGFENLYSKILEDLRRRVPEGQHEKVHRVFELLVAAPQPWTASTIEVALAVKIDCPSTQEDFMPDFEESLLELCGPLVEIRQDRIVRFIHLFVVEYLTNPEDLATRSSLSVILRDAHCSIANLGLAYLTHEVLHQPLSGDLSIRSHKPSIVAKYNFLPYAATYWSLHASLSMQALISGYENTTALIPAVLSQQRFLDFFGLLSGLTTNRMLATLWIEAGWTFEVPPSFIRLPDYLAQVADIDYKNQKRSLRKQVTTLRKALRRFSRNLPHLNKQWGSILKEEPNEIWLPSTNAFTDSEFWIRTNDAKVNWLSHSGDEQSVLIVSQVSLNGKDVGVIKVWPSRLVIQSIFVLFFSLPDLPHYFRPLESAKNCSVGAFSHLQLADGPLQLPNWTVAYQIWSLENIKMGTTIRFEIPAENILIEGNFESEQLGNRRKMPDFRFPVALSSCLGLAFIMGVVVQINDMGLDGKFSTFSSAQSHMSMGGPR